VKRYTRGSRWWCSGCTCDTSSRVEWEVCYRRHRMSRPGWRWGSTASLPQHPTDLSLLLLCSTAQNDSTSLLTNKTQIPTIVLLLYLTNCYLYVFDYSISLMLCKVLCMTLHYFWQITPVSIRNSGLWARRSLATLEDRSSIPEDDGDQFGLHWWAQCVTLA